MRQRNSTEAAGSELVVEAFTHLAPCYVETVDRELRQFWGLSYQDFIRRLLRAVPDSTNHLILDVATGAAQIPLMIAPTISGDDTVVGLDITPAMLQAAEINLKARGLTAQVRLTCASAMQMPFATGTFDLVICGLATHHMHVPRLLSEALRILHPGGHLVVADVAAPAFWRSRVGYVLLHTAATFYGSVQRSARMEAEIAAIDNMLTTLEWRDLLAASGFERIEIMAELPGRRLLYPGAVIIRANKKATQQQI